MPELPEVETTVRGMNSRVKNLTIKGFWCDAPGIIDRIPLAQIQETIIGKKIVEVRRRGKNILVDLSGGTVIRIHMKMTGHLMVGTWQFKNDRYVPISPEPLHDPYNRFIRALFDFGNSTHLGLCDSRKFARIRLFSHDHLPHDLAKLGPDPLDPEMTTNAWRERFLARPKKRIKEAMLDQTIVVGIGNIYSDEILWASGIHPLSVIQAIPRGKWEEIFSHTKKILSYSIELGGDSTSDYRNIDGLRGGFQGKHRAYHKTGTICTQNGCGGTIERTKIAQRSAHFCRTHQLLYT